MRHVAIDEILPAAPGPQGSMLGMNQRQQLAVRDLADALSAISRGGKLADHIAKARGALDTIEREASACPRCGVAVFGEHGFCRAPATDELREWLQPDPTLRLGRHWESNESIVQIGGKKPSSDHRVRLLENRRTVAVGTGPTAEAAERDALALLPIPRRDAGQAGKR